MSITRPQLQRRHTFNSSQNHVKQSIFNQSVPTMIDVLKEYGGFLHDFESRFPADFDQELKNQMMEQLRSDIVQHFNVIKHLKSNPDLFEKLKNGLLTMEEANAQKTDPASLKPFISDLMQSLVIGQLNALVPGVGFLFALSYPAAAAAASDLFSIQSGVPNGASDPCSGFGGYMVSCLKGYLADQSGSWQPELPQFFRLIQQGNGKGADDGAFLQLRDCLDTSAVGTAVKNALETHPGNNTASCVAQPAEWYGWQASATATSLPENACGAFQNEFATAAQNCMRYSGAAKWNGIIAGSVIGGVVVLSLCCATAYCLLKSSTCDNAPCC